MTVYISPNPGKSSARELALRAAQILRTHGASVLMEQKWKQDCNIAGVEYLPFEACMEQTDVILTIGGDGTILHVANLTLSYHKPILGINLGRAAAFWPPARWTSWRPSSAPWPGARYSLDSRMLLYVRVLGDDGWEGHALNDVVVTKGAACSRPSTSASTATTSWWSTSGGTGSSWPPPPAPPPISLAAGGPDPGLPDQGHRGHPPSAPTAWPPHPWSLPRSARSHLCGGRWRTTRCSSAATATTTLYAAGRRDGRWFACRTRTSS